MQNPKEIQNIRISGGPQQLESGILTLHLTQHSPEIAILMCGPGCMVSSHRLVSVCSGAKQNIISEQLLNNRNVLYTVLGAVKFKIRVLEYLLSDEGLLSDSQMGVF